MTDFEGNQPATGDALPPSKFSAGYSVGGQEPESVNYGAVDPYPMPAPEPPPPAYQGYTPPPPPPMPYPGPMPGYGFPPPVAYLPARKTNGLAIASLVCSILGLFCCFTALPGVILGHLASSQIKRTGEDGKGLAVGGLVVGYIVMGLVVGFLALALLFPAIGLMIGLSESPTSGPTYSG